MVFQGLFPASADEYESLKAAVERLSMNDPSVVRNDIENIRLPCSFPAAIDQLCARGLMRLNG